MYSPLLNENQKNIIQSSQPQQTRIPPHELQLSELGQFIQGQQKLRVPVYTVYGACEDVRVLEKFRSGEYKVPNLHLIDESASARLEMGGVKLRLLGLGGAVVMHKLFDNGDGLATIAGGQGTMWTTLLQMGELIDTASRCYDPTETRIFITHASPAREGLLNQLAMALKADFSISAGLHFRYGSSYNEFSVNPNVDHYRGKLAASKASFNDVWETVRSEVEPAVAGNEAQQVLLQNALEVVNKMPATADPGASHVDESAFKNMWNFNLADAAFGHLIMELQDGRIATEMRAQGFNFAHRSARRGSQDESRKASRSTQDVRKERPREKPRAPNGKAEPRVSQDIRNEPARPEGSNEPKPAKTGENEPRRLYVLDVEDKQSVNNCFPESDRAQIVRVETMNNIKQNHIVTFTSHEAAEAGLQHFQSIPFPSGGSSSVRWYVARPDGTADRSVRNAPSGPSSGNRHGRGGRGRGARNSRGGNRNFSGEAPVQAESNGQWEKGAEGAPSASGW